MDGEVGKMARAVDAAFSGRVEWTRGVIEELSEREGEPIVVLEPHELLGRAILGYVCGPTRLVYDWDALYDAKTEEALETDPGMSEEDLAGEVWMLMDDLERSVAYQGERGPVVVHSGQELA